MSRIALLFVLMALLVAPGVCAQPASGAAACPSATTLDELTRALDDAVSGPGNKDRTCLRALLLPDARLSPLGRVPDGKLAPHHLTVDDWINAVAKRGSEEIYERQVKVSTHQYGHIAELWCDYEIRPTPDGAATIHGVNSIQAVYDGAHWRVAAILWESEKTAGAAPGTTP
jgi:hypothetical protein